MANRNEHLDEIRAAGPETTPHRSRKDRKRWCRGKPGAEHVVEVRLTEWGPAQLWGRKCWRIPVRNGVWVCNHERVCVECGKILGTLRGRECPDWKP